MRVRLRLWLQIATAASAYAASADFLRSTLDKIQKERLDTMVAESSQPENNTEHQGEIIFDSEDNSLGHHQNSNFEFTFTNNLDTENHLTEINDQSKQNQHAAQSSGAHGNNDDEIQGYYYYFYPLNHYVHNKPSDQGMTPMKELDMMMDNMMKNNMMTKSESRVTPLFKAMTWFIGTAMLFVVSILLLPKFRVKKAKTMLQARDFRINGGLTLPLILEGIFMLPTSHILKQ